MLASNKPVAWGERCGATLHDGYKCKNVSGFSVSPFLNKPSGAANINLVLLNTVGRFMLLDRSLPIYYTLCITLDIAGISRWCTDQFTASVEFLFLLEKR